MADNQTDFKHPFAGASGAMSRYTQRAISKGAALCVAQALFSALFAVGFGYVMVSQAHSTLFLPMLVAIAGFGIIGNLYDAYVAIQLKPTLKDWPAERAGQDAAGFDSAMSTAVRPYQLFKQKASAFAVVAVAIAFFAPLPIPGTVKVTCIAIGVAFAIGVLVTTQVRSRAVAAFEAGARPAPKASTFPVGAVHASERAGDEKFAGWYGPIMRVHASGTSFFKNSVVVGTSQIAADPASQNIAVLSGAGIYFCSVIPPELDQALANFDTYQQVKMAEWMNGTNVRDMVASLLGSDNNWRALVHCNPANFMVPQSNISSFTHHRSKIQVALVEGDDLAFMFPNDQLAADFVGVLQRMGAPVQEAGAPSGPAPHFTR